MKKFLLASVAPLLLRATVALADRGAPNQTQETQASLLAQVAGSELLGLVGLIFLIALAVAVVLRIAPSHRG